MMQKLSFTITKRDGIKFSADHIFSGHHSFKGSEESQLAIHFVCSGGLATVMASEVESITFHPATFCNECDRPLPA